MTILGLHGKGKTLTGSAQPDKLKTPPKFLKGFIYVSIIICMFSIVFVLAIQKKLPPEIPLFYGLAEGQEQLAGSLWLILPSLTSLGIILINSLISVFWKNEFLQETLTLTSLAAAILSVITTLKIALLIGSF